MKQGMLVRFSERGCLIEKEGRIINRRRREGWMFILDSHEMKSTMFAKGHKVYIDIEIWHKRIDHINLQKLKEMQSSTTSPGTPKFFSYNRRVKCSHTSRKKNEVEKATNRHVWHLQSDGGKVYFFNAFTTYLRREGMRREFTCRPTT